MTIKNEMSAYLTVNEDTYVQKLTKPDRRDNEYCLEKDCEIEQNIIEEIVNGNSLGVKLA